LQYRHRADGHDDRLNPADRDKQAVDGPDPGAAGPHDQAPADHAGH
jgi:hypothetical protein